MVPGDRSLISIGYKYNSGNVIYFFTTEGPGITKDVIPFLSKYPNKFLNVVI